MVHRPVLLSCLAALAICAVAWCEDPWHGDLSYANGGYWRVRVPVTVSNTGTDDALGSPVEVVVGNGEGQAHLVGLPVSALRVVSSGGAEFLYGIRSSEGSPRRAGQLQTGDIITLPVEVAGGKTATLYIYADNPLAWLPANFMGGAFRNGGFEDGKHQPAHWRSLVTDARHRMFWQKGGARSGGYCARCEVDAGAEPTWVQYAQTAIPVPVGRKYRFTAWVKAQDVKGTAGWYVHVDGEKPLMVNVVRGWGGTFDWRQVVIEFQVPKGGQFFSCGTVLHGTGVAWYDDAKLEALGAGALEVSVGRPQRLVLARSQAPDSWPSAKAWQWRTPLVVRNFSDTPLRKVLVTADARRPATLLARLAGWRYRLPIRVIDPDNPDQPLAYGWSDGDLFTATSVPPRTEKVLMVYWSAEQQAPGASRPDPVSSWAASKVNLARNGDMEIGDGQRAADWPSGEEGRSGRPRFTVRRVHGGVHGQWALELSVPPQIKDVGWVGSRQKVPVKPNTRYLLAGSIKGRDLSGPARIHGHFLKADGTLCQPRPFFSTSPSIKGTADWTFTSVQVVTPPDCAFIEIHLTMNVTGTLWHDAVLLAEVRSGALGKLHCRQAPADALAIWVVNPLVKVFREDPVPPRPEAAVRIYACRNEYEPFQVALRSAKAGQVRVRASRLRGPGGATLPPPKVWRVGYVPVDFPIGYDSSMLPRYYRLRPRHRGNDGWAGMWPDPLVPLRDGVVELQAEATQPLWFDVHVPETARPGDYRGQVAISFDRRTYTVPVRLTVWPMIIPKRKHVVAIYDLRRGPGWDIFANADEWAMIQAWYQLLTQYNISPGLVYPTPQFSYRDGKLSIDFSDFDRACKLLFDKLHCNAAYTPWFFYSFGWGYPPKKLFGHEAFTEEWKRIFQGGLRQFFEHVRAKGWGKYFVYYASDEPDRRDEQVQSNLARVCDLARAAVPGILVYSSTWTHLSRLDGHLNLWGIGPQGTWPLEEIEARRKEGDRFWFTTDGQMCLDTPYLAIERLLPWFCMKYGVDGYEFWGVSWWTNDPWKYGWHKYIRQSHAGKVFRWVRYPNGDGFLTYPGTGIGQRDPVPSIRLVAAREGVEDYELFVALQARAARDKQAAQALQRALALVEMPNRGGRYSTAIMPNPDAVMQARNAAGKAVATTSP